MTLSPMDAMFEALSLHLPFAAGYFKAFGLNAFQWPRLHYRVFGVNVNDLSKRRDPYICVCPNSKSCESNFGRPANIKPPVSWWEEIVRSIDFPCFTLGATSDAVIPGTTPFHGRPFREVVQFMAGSVLVISVETGLLHLAGGIPGGPPVLFLSSATPSWFSAPPRSRVLSSVNPTEWRLSSDVSQVRVVPRSAPVEFPIRRTLELVRLLSANWK